MRCVFARLFHLLFFLPFLFSVESFSTQPNILTYHRRRKMCERVCVKKASTTHILVKQATIYVLLINYSLTVLPLYVLVRCFSFSFSFVSRCCCSFSFVKYSFRLQRLHGIHNFYFIVIVVAAALMMMMMMMRSLCIGVILSFFFLRKNKLNFAKKGHEANEESRKNVCARVSQNSPHKGRNCCVFFSSSLHIMCRLESAREEAKRNDRI